MINRLNQSNLQTVARFSRDKIGTILILDKFLLKQYDNCLTQKKMSIQKHFELAQIMAYTPPRLYVGKEWYVGFNAFDPIMGKLRRKKIKLNHIANKTERRKYASELIVRQSYSQILFYTKLRIGNSRKKDKKKPQQ